MPTALQLLWGEERGMISVPESRQKFRQPIVGAISANICLRNEFPYSAIKTKVTPATTACATSIRLIRLYADLEISGGLCPVNVPLGGSRPIPIRISSPILDHIGPRA